MKKILIVTPCSTMSEDRIRTQQSLVQMYCKESFGSDVKFESCHVVPETSISSENNCAHPLALSMAKLYQRIAESDEAFFAFAWESDRICQLIKSACEEYKIPHYVIKRLEV